MTTITYTLRGLRRGVLCAGLLAMGMACAANPGPGAVTTVILVRHAEKVDASRDPPLSPAGIERARTLLHVLGAAPIDAVYATPFHRTRETARPLADHLQLPIRETPVSATYATDVAARIRGEHGGHTVVVVGHSNTTPDVARALGITAPLAIADNQYDDLFLVLLWAQGQARLVRLRYGTPTP